MTGLARISLAMALIAGSLTACERQKESEPAQESVLEVEVLVSGSHFHGIHGLTFGPDEMIYTGSVVGMSIHRVDPETGAVTLHEGPPEGQADDLEFGPDGTLAWTAFALGKVFSRAPGGERVTLAEGLPGLNSIAYNQEGRLFATQVFLGDALYELDVTGETPPRKIIEGMGGLNGFDFGPDGKLYGPLWFKGQIARVDVETGELEVVAEGFTVPAAANFDSQGNLYAIDNETGEIFRINVEAKTRHLIATAPTNLDNLAFDANDRLYVTNMSDNGIYEINTETGDIRSVIAGPLTTPGGIAYYPSAESGTLYVADTFTLSKVEPASGQVSDISRLISDHEYPTEVAASEAHILTSSFNAGMVQIYDRASEQRITRWTGFLGPIGIAELEEGRVLVAEAGTGRLLLVEGADGSVRTVLAEGLDGPADVVLTDDGIVYVSENTGGRIFKFDLVSGEHSIIAEGLSGPEGMALATQGKLIVAEVGKAQLIEIDPNTGESVVIVGDLPIGLMGYPAAPPAFILTGVATDPDDNIYVASDIDNSILKISR